MRITEQINGTFRKGHQGQVLEWGFWGKVAEEAHDYFDYFDFTGPVTKVMPEMHERMQEISQYAPVKWATCRFLYQGRYFKTSEDTDDFDLVLGAILEKDKRKTAREKKLREIGRSARTTTE